MAMLSVSPQVLFAQVLVRDVFKQMPDCLLPYLSQNNKLDMMDYLDSHMKAEVKNSFDGNTEMTAMTDDYMSIQLNESSRIELLLLPVSEPIDSASQIICMIKTLGTQSGIRESDLSFYSVNWKTLPSENYYTAPSGVYSAEWNSSLKELTLCSNNFLDIAANEEQKSIEVVLIKFNWMSGFNKKY